MMAATTDPNMAPAPAANESDSDPDAVVPPEEAPPPPLLSATGLHSHRLNHTASKLSSFRLADRDGKLLHNSNQPQHSGSLVAHQPQQHPSPPVSPHTGPAGPAGTHSTPLPVGTAPHHSAQNPSAFPENSISAPAPLRRHLLPPSTLSPVTETNDPNPASSQQHQNHTDTSDDSPHSIISPFQESPRSRTSSNRTVSTSAPVTPLTTFNKRSASLNSDNAPIPSTPPDPARSQTDADSPSFWTPASRPRTRRASLSSRASSLGRSPIPLARTRSKESSQTTAQQQQQQQQDHTTSQTANHSSPPDESRTLPRRRSSTSSRPPLSYRSVSGRPIIPPIRSFRSSGSRRSSQIDMNGQSSHYYDDGDEYHDPHARDRSLRALEGRINNDWQRDADADDDNVTESENNTADIFMNIAREDSFPSGSRRRTDGRGEDDQNSVISKIARNPRQRPMSTIYTSSASQVVPSPASGLRRLSDQQGATPRRRRTGEDLPDQYTSNRDLTYTSVATEKPSLKLDAAHARSTVPTLKPSPITPRTQSVLDNSDRSAIFARRPPTTEHSRTRSTSIRQPTGLSKSFSGPSPSVRKNPEPQPSAAGHPEASESSNSTAAPSTVWDELDELKSRIHRLELTGKMPKTSGAAISRASEAERPPTAGTGATTISGSPKRASGVGPAPTEVQSTASAQRDQPILKSALAKTKPFVSSEVFDAIEAAAADALSLSQLMGTVGQPGPISSGASTIGVGGVSTVTDRQLRKKTDSICRNLTELCLALTEEGNQRNGMSRSRPQTRGTSRQREEDTPNSPPMRIFTGANQQRQLAKPDEVLPSIEDTASPRATRLDKRATFNFTGMTGSITRPISNFTSGAPASRYPPSTAVSAPGPTSAAPTPRYAYAPSAVDDPESGRKSSLIVARARRGVTEDPDDPGRRTSLLRTRRAGTDEPADDSRKTSLSLAPRRVTTIGRVSNIDEEPQVASRVPSRAITDIRGGLRIAVPPSRSGETGRIQREVQEPASATAALPRRRLIAAALPTPTTSAYASRLATPTTPSARRFLQVGRGAEDRGDAESVVGERMTEGRMAGERYSIGAPSQAGLGRTTSLHRKRISGTAASFSGPSSHAGGYR